MNACRLWLWSLGVLSALTIVACGGSSSSSGTGGAAGSAGGGSGGTSGGGGTGGSTSDAGLTCFDANGTLIAHELKTCTGNTCAIVAHQISCCGDVLLIGVDSSHLAELSACEDAWRATQGQCGCPAGPPQVEQPAGTTVGTQDDAVAECGNWTNTSGICIAVPKQN